MPIDYGRYPADWFTAVRPRILERAGNRCEWCGAENGAVGWRGADGQFHPGLSTTPIEAAKLIRIVLTIAHLDHDTNHNDPSNLVALCQQCHLRHDREHHRINAARTRRQRKLDAGQLAF